MRDSYLFTSEPMKIGKKEWRLIIYDANGYLGCRAFTDYEWRYPAWGNLRPGDWESSKAWPSYNSNDTYDGLPRTLRKLYDRHSKSVKQFCGGG
jgi:hypothetical protein